MNIKNFKDNSQYISNYKSCSIYKACITSQFLLLFITLYLLKKFDYMKYVKISLKAFLKLIVFTILLVGITKCLLDIFHIYNFTIWTGIKEKSLYWVSWVDYVGAILFIFLFVFVALRGNCRTYRTKWCR
ncbi:MAG: Abortive infection protein [Caldanaerobacter subterraneus]|nr:MAG: CAAX amino terminal protease family [Thermoanaerobacter thermocopriae]KUK35394.1 MAG: Abortive infection protein [Caldanaerobacter subterraneus]